MSRPKDRVDELLNELVPKGKKERLITVYYPNNSLNKAEMAQKVKSLLGPALKKSRTVSGYSSARQKLISEVSKKIINLQDLGEGIGIFVKYRFENHDHQNEIVIRRLKRGPRKEVTIGRVYDTDQLLWAESFNTDSIVLTLEHNRAKLWLSDEKVELIREFSNQIVVADRQKRDYLGGFGPTNKGLVFHGTGGNKMERERQAEDRMMFKLVMDFLATNEELTKKLDTLVLVYSASYQEMMEEFRQELLRMLPHYFILLIKTNIDNADRLGAIAKKRVAALRSRTVRDLYHQSKENIGLFAQGWEETVGASRLGKIEKLFVRPRLKEPGYIMDDQLIYLKSPGNKSVRSNNISPWLVREVVRQGGEVVVVRDRKLMEGTDIAAQLRF
jgi:hypothetical protein